ncbi:MAG: YqiA/YcfP family alpha/beta fold hydrolase [Saprospiraceae bacterium]
MRILYIHGLNSFPHPERLTILEQKKHETFALHLDYENEPNTFKLLKTHALKHEVDFIIGSSAGGYIGYWLGQELGIPQLLFNPAVGLRDIKNDVGYEIKENENLKSWVVVGKNDDTVLPKGTLKFYENKNNVRIIICQWLAHQIDLQTFEECVNWSGL